MAKILNNPLLQGVHGQIGKTFVKKELNGKGYLANMPSERRRLSKKQKENSERFREATQYAKMQMAIPEAKAAYQRAIGPNKNTAFRVAVTDYLNAPVVHKINVPDYTGSPGDRIFIHATDDFRVTAVKIQITDGKGKLIEQGDAIQNPRKRHRWKYITTAANKNVSGTVIKATAHDRPGNKTTGEVRV